MISLMLACSSFDGEGAGAVASAKYDTGTTDNEEQVDVAEWWPLQTGTWTYTGDDGGVVLSVRRLHDDSVVTRLRREAGGLVMAWLMERKGGWDVTTVMLLGGVKVAPNTRFLSREKLGWGNYYGDQIMTMVNEVPCAAGTCLERTIEGRHDALDSLTSTWVLQQDGPPLQITVKEETWSLSL